MKQNFKTFIYILFILLIQISSAQQFTLMHPDSTSIHFVNTIHETNNFNVFNYEYMYNGGGVALGDINNDGLLDIFFSGNMSPNELYLNKGNMKFENITEMAKVNPIKGFNTGVTMIDINGDGWLDIYVCQSASNDPSNRRHNLYINNKNLTFSEQSNFFGLADSSLSTQAYFYDMDLDGDMDLFLLNHPRAMGESKKIVLSYNQKGVLEANDIKGSRYENSKYYENVQGKFIDKSKSAGITKASFGLSAIIADFNQDNFPDIYVCNDYSQPDYLYINNKNKTFTEKSDSFFTHYSYNSMGSDYADIDNDGFDDLIVLDMLPESNYRQKQFKLLMSYDQFEKLEKYNLKAQYVKNVLQHNNRGQGFSDISYATQMAHTDWSWAPLMADFDNDGWKDIYITNGYNRNISNLDVSKFKIDSILKVLNSQKDKADFNQLVEQFESAMIPNYYYKNLGGLKFQKNPQNTGLNIPSLSNGAAYGDLDNDGDLDIVVNNLNHVAFVFRNNVNSNYNFVRIKYISSKGNSVYGIKTELKSDSLFQSVTFNPNKGYLSTHEPFVHFGLGANTHADALICLNSGQKYLLKNLLINKVTTIDIDTLKNQVTIPKNTIQPIFEDNTVSSKLNYTHKENNYIDFKQEPLLPKKYSRQGPCVAIGDINGDNLDDIFYGGAIGQSREFWVQNLQGQYQKLASNAFSQDNQYEDVKALFVDFDLDGDLDLIVVSGGNEYPNQMEKYPLRCYLNDGKGNFSKSTTSTMPQLNVSGAALVAIDIDHDGYKDLFVGGKIIPGHYGLFPDSYLLRNIKGHFQIDTTMTSLKNLGMISDAIEYDFDHDGWNDLVLVGEWMPPVTLKNEQGTLSNIPQRIGNLNGWWTKIKAVDLDNDHIDDLVLGNYGINSRYTCPPNRPMQMLVKDFDQNGSTDIVISVFSGDTSYPVALRDQLLDQMPFLKKRFTRYEPYSRASILDIFTQDEMKKCSTLTVNTMHSMVAYNKGNGNFDMKKLPVEAQYFPINGINALDIDRDGDMDLLLSGNDYNAEIETGRMDAGIGLVLENVGNQKWRTKYNTGYDTKGDVKSVLPLTIQGKLAWLVSRNADKSSILQLTK